MAVCVHDNPVTMSRECWEDGELFRAYSAFILPPFAESPIPAEHFFFGANIGPWKEGQIVGNPEAIGEER